MKQKSKATPKHIHCMHTEFLYKMFSLPNELGSRFSIEGLLIPMGSKSAEWCPRNYTDRNM